MYTNTTFNVICSTFACDEIVGCINICGILSFISAATVVFRIIARNLTNLLFVYSFFSNHFFFEYYGSTAYSELPKYHFQLLFFSFAEYLRRYNNFSLAKICLNKMSKIKLMVLKNHKIKSI